MTFWNRFRSGVHAILQRSRMEREMDAELRFHLDAYAEDLVRSGISREEATRRARLEFGGIEQAKEQCRDARGVTFLDSLLQDLRFGMRMLCKSPGFTAVAVATLALGIGANAAIFSMINAVMLRPLPVRDAQQLVVFGWRVKSEIKYHGYDSYEDCDQDSATDGCSFSLPFFERFRSDAKFFSNLAAFSGPMQLNVSGNGPASIGRGELVSGNFFETLGVEMSLGRPISPDDDNISSPVVVLSYAYWKGQFASDPNVLGHTIRLNGAPCTIIGVASRNFTNLAAGKTQDLFVPLHSLNRLNLGPDGESVLTDPQSWWAVIVGRLKPGVSLDQAQSAASAFFYNEMIYGAKPMSKAQDYPSISLLPLNRGLSGRRGRYAVLLYILMVAVGTVLLIVCANVAGLTLARSNARQREVAVRLALGGARHRVARQLLTESVMLSIVGGVAGLLVAQWGVRVLQLMLSAASDEPFSFIVSPDWRVFSFSLCISALTGLLFGIAPALRLTQVNLSPALKEGPSTFQGRSVRGVRLSGALVVAQVALCVLVLVSAGLLVRTLRDLRSIDPGFDSNNILLFAVDPSVLNYDEDHIQNLYRQLRDRFATLPGVTSASYSSVPLLSGWLKRTELYVPGQTDKTNADADLLEIGPDFFKTLRMPLLDGRTFTAADYAIAQKVEAVKMARLKAKLEQGNATAKTSPSVAPLDSGPPVPILVNREFVKRYLPKQTYLGHLVEEAREENSSSPPDNPGFEIVGLVGNTKYQDLRSEIAPTVYIPLTRGGSHFELRTAIEPTALIPSIRSIVNEADSNLPIYDIRTQSMRIEQLIYQEKIIAHLSTFFGLLALLLACIGLYGLLAYEVARRTREIGVRIALGAQQRDVVSMVVKQGIVLVLLGAAFGVAAGLGLTRYLRSLLYGVDPLDPITFIEVVALLVVVALVACYIPARRAAQVDPMVALRYE